LKTYKRTIYWFNTSYGCGAVGVDQDGYVYEYDTAPLYRWMVKSRQKFFEIKKNLLKRNKLYNCKRIAIEKDPF
jgi:hypothetical protein